MDGKYFRTIYYYKNYYLDFFADLKNIEGIRNLHEIRVEVGSDIYRVFLMRVSNYRTVEINYLELNDTL
jgi:hypothetical protein